MPKTVSKEVREVKARIRMTIDSIVKNPRILVRLICRFPIENTIEIALLRGTSPSTLCSFQTRGTAKIRAETPRKEIAADTRKIEAFSSITICAPGYK